VNEIIRTGEAQRADFGFTRLAGVSPERAEELGGFAGEGMIVVALTEDSPTALAGIREDDIIMKIDGTPVEDIREALRLLGSFEPTDVVNFQIIRDRMLQTVTVDFAAKPEEVPEVIVAEAVEAPEAAAPEAAAPEPEAAEAEAPEAEAPEADAPEAEAPEAEAPEADAPEADAAEAEAAEAEAPEAEAPEAEAPEAEAPEAETPEAEAPEAEEPEAEEPAEEQDNAPSAPSVYYPPLAMNGPF